MPRNLTARLDLMVILGATLFLVLTLGCFSPTLGFIAFVIWLCMTVFAQERCKFRSESFDNYCHNIISNVNAVSNFAMDQLPLVIMVVSTEGRIMWFNKELKKEFGTDPEYGAQLDGVFPELSEKLEQLIGKSGRISVTHNDVHYYVVHRPVATVDNPNGLLALYIYDMTEMENLQKAFDNSRIILAYIQIDNYEEVTQGMSEAQRSTLIYESNQVIDEWVHHLNGTLRRLSPGMYIAIFEKKYIRQAVDEKFDVLDKVRKLHNTNLMPVTISMGIAAAENQSMEELGIQAMGDLDLALGRGGDQVVLNLDGKTQFFGGRAQAVEKNTRVKARVVANSLYEIMNHSDEIFVMGHHNEDFDALGAAMGVARMARHLKKPTHIVLSSMNAGIDKFTDILKTKEDYADILLPTLTNVNITAKNPLLVVVDTHIPHLTAAPALLSQINRIVVIDHHRRNEEHIKNTLLTYLEPSPSSCSEMVTELLMYFDEKLYISRLDATALYAGIVVDTKNFTIQTGVRTFDAAAYLRRSGVDPVIVRQLFRSDYETDLAKAKAKAASQLFPGGLIATTCVETVPNIQVIAAQVADSLLRIDKVRVSIVVCQLTSDTVSISARSTRDINVQVIMEKFGGGGHQNVAGAQIKGKPLNEIYDEVIKITQEFIEEIDKHESNSTAGR